MTQLFLNAKELKTIKITLFYVNYKRELNLFKYEKLKMLIKVAKNKIDKLKEIHKNILKMQQRFAKYINKKRKEASLVKKKNKVDLLTRNLKKKKKKKKIYLKKINILFIKKIKKKKKKKKKLNLIKINAFFIKEIKESKTYELNLLKNAKRHKILNISLLKLIDLNALIQETFCFKSQQEEKFEIEKIL